MGGDSVEEEALGQDNPFRPPTSKGSFAPPSTGGDEAAAAKRAAALAKLREMTQGKMLDDPRLAGHTGLGPADSLLGGPAGVRPDGGSGPGLGMSAAALREARMKAEMLKAKHMQARRHPADEEDDDDDDGEQHVEAPEGAGSHPDAMPSRDAARMGHGLTAAGRSEGQGKGRPEASADAEAHQWFQQAKMGEYLLPPPLLPVCLSLTP